jgi:hypothetical protein
VPYVALPAPGSPSNSATTTGIPKFKTGNRNLLFSVKYFF